jgi:hypothetical protein
VWYGPADSAAPNEPSLPATVFSNVAGIRPPLEIERIMVRRRLWMIFGGFTHLIYSVYS